MANIEVAVRVLATDMRGILRQAGAIAEIPVRAHIIRGVRIGVAHHHTQPVIVARIQSNLQAVVVRFVDIPHLEDVGQVGELFVQRLRGRLVPGVGVAIVIGGSTGETGGKGADTGAASGPARANWRLVDVANAGEIRPVIAYVSGFEGQIRGECVLEAQVPAPHVRSGETTVDGHDGTRATGIAAGQDGSAIDGDRAAVRTVERRGWRVPWNRVQEVFDGDVAGGDGATRCLTGCVDRGSGRNAARTESVVEGDEGLPVDGLIDQAATAAEDGT